MAHDPVLVAEHNVYRVAHAERVHLAPADEHESLARAQPGPSQQAAPPAPAPTRPSHARREDRSRGVEDAVGHA